jgi:ABC-type nitrate/sulfonate/bicarbonate transport system substrate-binding protein
MKRLPWTVLALVAAVLLAGCGEVTNTLTPQPGTENLLTVALDSKANFTHVGIFEAEALGYFRQTDLKVRFITPANPLKALTSGTAQVAIAPEPAIILVRNTHISLASVAAILQGPQRVQVSCTSARSSSHADSTPGTTTAGVTTAAPVASASTPSPTTSNPTTGAPRSHAPLHPAHCDTKVIAVPEPRYAKAPTYNGLDFTVTEDEIVDHAPILRRFIQAVGRGYVAARADPRGATENLVKLNPGLNFTQQLAGVRASMSNFFPPKTITSDPPWGRQTVLHWDAFGYWMLTHKVITDVDATPDAVTNELLAGQGV